MAYNQCSDAAGKLQIMDVHTNGPYKAGQRRIRCNALFNYFQGWKVKRLQQMALPEAQRVLPKFEPPKPTLANALLTAMKAAAEVFGEEKFKAGMRRAFIQRSQFHDMGIWFKYSNNRMGKIKVAQPIPANTVALADVVTPVEVEPTVEPTVEEAKDESDSESGEDEDPSA
jgi:hypothetical protein